MTSLIGIVAWFATVYVIFKIIASTFFPSNNEMPRRDGFPSLKQIFLRKAHHKASDLVETGGGSVRQFFGGTVRRSRSASFISSAEMNRLLNSRNKGMLFGAGRRLSLENSYMHTLILGATGSGKTTAYVLPNLYESKTSIICTDIKGELFHLTSGYLRKKGFQIRAINLIDISQSMRFNPLLRMRENYNEIRQLASILVNIGLRGSDAFWQNHSKDLLSLIFLALTFTPDEYCTLLNARYLLAKFGSEQCDTFMIRHLPSDFYRALYFSIRDKEERVRSNIQASAESCLEFINDPVIAEITSSDNFDVSYLRENKGVLYLMCPIRKLRNYAPFLSLLYYEIFAYLQESPVKRKTVPISMILDEAGQIYINDLDIISTTIRAKQVSLSMILQEFSQFRTLYGRDRSDTILRGGVNTRLFFKGLSSEVTQEASESLGTKEVQDIETGQITLKPLLTPQQIRQLDSKEALIVHGNYPPLRTTMIPYYENSSHLRRSRITPIMYDYGYAPYQPILLNL